MTIVAVYAVPENRERAVDILSDTTGMSKYEAASRLRLSEKVPVIVASYASPAEADKVAAKLSSAGLSTIVMEGGKGVTGRDHFAVRTFSFEDTLLRAGSRQNDQITVDYGDVRLIICGKGIRMGKETVTEKSMKFSPGRAVMTGGLMMTRKEEKHRERVTENREGFIYLYGQTETAVIFREHDLDYSSLGTAIKPSQHANFTYIAGELKKRCCNASYDDSLLNKNVQMQILGALFDPEEHLGIAISLIKLKNQN